MFALSPYDLIWTVGALLSLGLTFAALVVWFRTRWSRTGEAVLTLLVILVVPILGPAAFLTARRRRPAQPDAWPHSAR
ncbi:hypothetical protein [Promicromonospora iranensis]|uniref:Phospholipase D-like protein n=1 Tax=Promicromonospora iranensis TaxID=1105144 RepID=A0ABU2CND5_9MICO|nr:hypothetical protein [Promicromonospora iranensis]MDR7382844.1 hypothetical protein [Promicromonospora iranensis]